ncbi:MAG: methyl-accepting chemotaxis protein [Pseudomonadota bacterium]|nr:methyl-accepting chemotaxis protein [Pseudomonadota bacterium]
MKINRLLSLLLILFILALTVAVINGSLLFVMGQKKAESQRLALKLAEVNQHLPTAMQYEMDSFDALVRLQGELAPFVKNDVVETVTLDEDEIDLDMMLAEEGETETVEFNDQQRFNALVADLELIISEESSIAEVASKRERVVNVLSGSKNMNQLLEQLVSAGAPSNLVSYVRQRELFLSLFRTKLANVYGKVYSPDNQELEELVPAFYDAKTATEDSVVQIRRFGSSEGQVAVDYFNDLKDDFEVVISPTTLDIIGNKGFATSLKAASRAYADATSINTDNLLASPSSWMTKFQPHFPNRDMGYISLAIAVFSLVGYLLINLLESSRQRSQAQYEKEQSQEAILRLLDELEPVAEGDLSAQMTVTEDATGTIADAINLTLEQLRSLVVTIDNAAKEVDSSAGEAQERAKKMTAMANSREKHLSAAIADVNRILKSIENVSEKTHESSDVAKKSVDIAEHGATVVEKTIEGMNNIRNQIQDTTKRVKRLGESSQEIGDTVALISDIADQTNILALNSAIQASMAGEAGRGFAVVSDEIQRLSEKTNTAAKRIDQLVSNIKNYTSEAVFSMEETTTEVVQGTESAQNAGRALKEIQQVSRQVSDIIEEIYKTTQGQASTAKHVETTMAEIDKQSEGAKTDVQITMQSVNTLAQLSEKLRESVDDFIVPSIQVAETVEVEEGYEDDNSIPSLTLKNE